MTILLQIAERVLNRPLAVHPDKLPLVVGVLEGRIPIGDVSELRRVAEGNIEAMPAEAQAVMRGPSPAGSRFVGESFEDDPQTGRARRLPYRRTSDGVAIITVTGALINRGAWVGSYSGETSYEGVKHQVSSAAADPRTKAILLDIESPGGEAVGAFEAAAAVRTAAAVKPVAAVANGMAASAAYALASSAHRVVATPTSLVGSIGIVMLHADYSRQLDARGITPTLIFAGTHKIDGNPFEPLSTGVREDLQAEVDQYYALFVKAVAAGRKSLSPSAIRATEARTFIGADAVKNGLADSVGTFEDVLADLSRGARRTTSIAKGSKMDNKDAPAAEVTGITKEEHDSTIATARAETTKSATEAANARAKAILCSEHAKGREALAQHFAFSTDLTAEAAIAALAQAPAAEQRGSRLNGIVPSPQVDAGEQRPADASAGWSKATERVNRSRGFAN